MEARKRSGGITGPASRSSTIDILSQVHFPYLLRYLCCFLSSHRMLNLLFKQTVYVLPFFLFSEPVSLSCSILSQYYTRSHHTTIRAGPVKEKFLQRETASEPTNFYLDFVGDFRRPDTKFNQSKLRLHVSSSNGSKGCR